MKKIVFIAATLALLPAFACTNPKGTLETVDPVKIESKTTSAYDIEIPFDDPLFCQIIDGEVIPVEVTHGIGGEGGYFQYKSNDPAIIEDYIKAFRNLKIEETITNEDDFVYIFDGINDYIFRLDGGTEVPISMDLSAYVIKDGTQYVFEYSEELNKLNQMLEK